MAETQAQFIANEMAMDEKTAQQFVETFCQFQKEIWALGPRPKREKAHLSDKEAEQAMNERFAHSQKILDLRKKYYLKYSKFLTPTQIENRLQWKRWRTGPTGRTHRMERSGDRILFRPGDRTGQGKYQARQAFHTS